MDNQPTTRESLVQDPPYSWASTIGLILLIAFIAFCVIVIATCYIEWFQTKWNRAFHIGINSHAASRASSEPDPYNTISDRSQLYVIGDESRNLDVGMMRSNQSIDGFKRTVLPRYTRNTPVVVGLVSESKIARRREPVVRQAQSNQQLS